jgi:NucS shadow ORF
VSLNVAPELLVQAERGDVDEAAFVETVRRSLPYAYQLIDGLVAELHLEGAESADNQVPPPSEAERGQLLRAMASDAIRASLERHFDVRLAFQNCHRVAVFRPDVDDAAYERFTSARAQVLNQSPELRDC